MSALSDYASQPPACGYCYDVVMPYCGIMGQTEIIQTFHLQSNVACRLLRIRNDIIPHYYLLCFPKASGEPTSNDITEMFALGVAHAQALSRETLGDPEAFSVLYSGYSARREKGWHVHIVLLGSRWRKAWLYSVLALKNILQALGLRKDDAPRA